MIKTVTLSGTEVTVDGLGGFNTVVHNMSSGTVYASKYPNIVAGADDVAEIPAGAVKLISTTNGKVYLVGGGRVELTGQDYDGVNYSSSAVTAVVGEGSGVTEQFVTEQDALNLEAARSYADGILKDVKDSLEQQISQSADKISQMSKNISAAENKAETALAAVEDIADKSIVSEDGAFDLRFHDDKLQAKVGGNWSDITAGGGENGGVSQAYVDNHDADTLTAANDYTDSKAAEIQEAARSYAGEKASEAADRALEAAKEHTDTEFTKKADKPINAFVLIGTENWQTDDNGEYPHYYDIPVEGASSADRADVFFAADSEEAAKKCEFSTEVTTSDGFVKIRAKHIPETVLSANVQIGMLSATDTLHVGANGGSTAVGEGVEEHNADPEAHPDIRACLNELKGRIIALEVAAGGEINANSFAVTFGDLDGVIADGVWVPATARLEF